VAEGQSLIRDVSTVIGRYLTGQFKVSLILAGLYAIPFALLGVPVWPLMAVLCGFLNMIPIFGPPIGILITAALTWPASGFYQALGVVGAYAAIQAFEGFYLSPRILGKQLSLPPLAVFFGVLVAGALFGFVGLLAAVPVMALLLIFWKYARRTS
jgi:predicted PurR-regulated permease PerM